MVGQLFRILDRSIDRSAVTSSGKSHEESFDSGFAHSASFAEADFTDIGVRDVGFELLET